MIFIDFNGEQLFSVMVFMVIKDNFGVVICLDEV